FNMAAPCAKQIPPLLSKFQGCLASAVIGDCLGASWEGMCSIKMREINKYMSDLENKHAGKPLLEFTKEYTDDTAMARQVAMSLIENQGFDASSMAKRFSEEYFEEPWRGYGGNVINVFQQLKDLNYKDPFKPSQEQFGGSGSYGNGGAMRIAPAALFSYNSDIEELNALSRNITMLTHSNINGINGAILESSAIYLALHQPADEPLDVNKYIGILLEIMKKLECNYAPEKELEATPSELKQTPYCDKLNIIKELLKEEETSIEDIEKQLGHNISALESVPTAIYTFLRGLSPIPGIEDQGNPLKRTVMFAIAIGGDVDTIGTMAAAITGAYYGMDIVPQTLTYCCEGVQDSLKFAHKLHTLAG
ncbi:unnamed protein product, partial [Owenia fusiformis]